MRLWLINRGCESRWGPRVPLSVAYDEADVGESVAKLGELTAPSPPECREQANVRTARIRSSAH